MYVSKLVLYQAVFLHSRLFVTCSLFFFHFPDLHNMVQHLPQEILDSVIDELGAEQEDAESFEALLACSLTSWSMLCSSRKKIFANIRIVQGDAVRPYLNNSEKDRTKLVNLLQILEGDPVRSLGGAANSSLASCVRSFEITFSPTRSTLDMFDEAKSQSEQRKWDALNETVPSLLNLLHHLERVSISFHEVYWAIWSMLSPDLTSSILRLLRSPSLRTLELTAISGLPVDAVLCCSNLQNLTLSRMFDEASMLEHLTRHPYSPRSPSSSVLPECAPRLKKCSLTLTSQYTPMLIGSPVAYEFFRELQELHLCLGHDMTYTDDWSVLRLASSLQVLKLSYIRSTDRKQLSYLPSQLVMADASFTSRSTTWPSGSKYPSRASHLRGYTVPPGLRTFSRLLLDHSSSNIRCDCHRSD